MYPLYTEAFRAVLPRQYEKILIFRDALKKALRPLHERFVNITAHAAVLFNVCIINRELT